MTVERGFDYFVLAERDVEENKRVRVQSTGFYDPYFNYSFYRPRFGWSRGYRYSRFNGYDPFFNDFDVREITKYRATAEVKFGKGAKPSNKDNAFNAREVLENLSSSIDFPEEET